MAFYIIGDEDSVLGFNLIGVSGKAVENVDEARESFHKMIDGNSIKILLITERVAELLQQEIDEHRAKMAFPIVVEIPDMGGPIPTRKSIADIVRSAIGIEL